MADERGMQMRRRGRDESSLCFRITEASMVHHVSNATTGGHRGLFGSKTLAERFFLEPSNSVTNGWTVLVIEARHVEVSSADTLLIRPCPDMRCRASRRRQCLLTRRTSTNPRIALKKRDPEREHHGPRAVGSRVC